MPFLPCTVQDVQLDVQLEHEGMKLRMSDGGKIAVTKVRCMTVHSSRTSGTLGQNKLCCWLASGGSRPITNVQRAL